ncbi:EH signature domain-containing protein [Pelobacter seleniigenes]|uniref:EH signature domain-containing protein n=1 Tax=Pelobacter seleniigenes TaxID=407188 RepID=UPI0004A7863C|nr:EH signature domain-containing protein [Pelobacter seleniigenes]
MSLRKLGHILFDLPEWTSADFAVIRKNQEEISKLASRAANSSDRFKDACHLLWRLAKNGQSHAISAEIKSSIEVRALSFLLCNDMFLEHVSFTKELLDSLYKPSSKLGRLSLLQLVEAFFKQFDKLGEGEDLEYFAGLIRFELQRVKGSDSSDELTRLGQHRDMLFALKGPNNVVDFARKKKLDLDQALDTLALHGFHGGRFQELCRYYYYLETLRALPVGKDHPVLSEVCKSDVYNAPSKDGRLMGHDILQILIDKASQQEISDPWRHVIMTIAGDPRVPKSNRRYQQWWYLLGEKRIQKVRGWLSRVDLLLFLDILEDYGRSTGQDDLIRMFPARKAFLEGLHRQGLIYESRLFISNSAERYVRRKYQRQDLPEYARVNDSYRSMIYLKVGDFHIIEGSHSFKFWIFRDIPSEASIFDYAVKRFTTQELSSDLKYLSLKEAPTYGQRPVSIRHNPHGFAWQAEAIAALRRLGLRLDLEQLFSAADYRGYKMRHGL